MITNDRKPISRNLGHFVIISYLSYQVSIKSQFARTKTRLSLSLPTHDPKIFWKWNIGNLKAIFISKAPLFRKQITQRSSLEDNSLPKHEIDDDAEDGDADREQDHDYQGRRSASSLWREKRTLTSVGGIVQTTYTQFT